jgi:tRNA A-37 threonylcarbamoyl transferase component Bud32
MARRGKTMTATAERLAVALADRYRIYRELGQGGMATVYLAEDVRHRRKVALKVLHPELSAVLGPERFLKEIELTASLQHPHILPLFDSGSADGHLFYVMPFVDGETLRARLEREQQLPIADAVRLATEVADALQYAHERGVIHRDIKPENILLQGGHALVADFGIALAVQQAGGQRMTQTGLSLGTPQYMSPEQAMGEKATDARTDIYALGAVTYEMLVGEPPFTGPNAQAIVARVLTAPPAPPAATRTSVPAHVEQAVLTALAKLPADRFGSARAFADALGNPGLATPRVPGSAAAPASTPNASRRALAGLTMVAAALLGTTAWGWLRPTPPGPVSRYALAFPALEAPDPIRSAAAPAPDGSFIIYRGPDLARGPEGQLWLKRRDSDRATPIAGTANAGSFAISPDGQWLAFTSGNQLLKVPVSGGPATALVKGRVATSRGLAWLGTDTVVFPLMAFGGIGRVSASGTTEAPSIVWKADSLVPSFPQAVADGRALIFTACAVASCADANLWAIDLRSGNARAIGRGGFQAQAPTNDRIVFLRSDGVLMGARFDPSRLEVEASPVALLDNVKAFSVSPSGMLVVEHGAPGVTSGRQLEMVWVERDGRESAVDPDWTFELTRQAGNVGWRLSPDGTRLAIGLHTEAGDDIWVKALPRGPVSRLSFAGGSSHYRPSWSADGRHVLFAASGARAGLYRRRADGTGADSIIFAGALDEGVLSPDVRWVLLRQGNAALAAGGRDITGFRTGVDSAPRRVLATPFDECAIALSPDGRWMAYQSDETGRTEVFIRPFPAIDAGKWQVSSGGGVTPLWSRNGRELFFVGASRNMMAVAVTSGETLRLGEPRVLFEIPETMQLPGGVYYTPWDVAADGRFLMARTSQHGRDDDAPLTLVDNWFQELYAKVPR